MAGSFSDYMENTVLDWAFGGSTPTRPTARYIGLFTAAPGETGGGTEVSGGGYARQAATFSASSGGATGNSAALTYTANGAAWGTIVGIGIYDAATAGNLIAYGTLAASKTINDGDSFQFPAAAVAISLD